MKNRVKGFTLVELLVVISIIAVLIGILLPALSRARDQAMTVQCASNMRQLSNAFVMYQTIFKGWVLPAQAGNGNSGAQATEYWWLGTQTLGKTLGMKGNDPAEMVTRLAKLVDCPATNREKIPGRDFSFDYSYNSNLGDIRGQNPTDPDYGTQKQAHFFKKFNQVPGNVLVAIDSNEPLVKDDERFDILSEITWKKAFGGHPHNGKKKGNVLFFNGSVKLCKIFTPPPGFTLGTDPGGPTSRYTDLQNWMICHPGHLEPGSINNGGLTTNDVWKEGRVIPF